MQEMRRTREGIGGMTMDREKKIAEIRKALDAATPGPWENVQLFYVGVTTEGRFYPVAECDDQNNAILIANAPEWLRFLLDELDRLRAERYSHGPEGRNYTNVQYVDLLAERNKLIEGLRMCLFNHGCWREEDYVVYMRDILKEVGVTVEWQKSANDMRTTR
jgi:hypothetical protein